MLEILGYICALLVGISMGLIGGGGSILAVPIFAYLFGLDPVTSTAYSLFVVGSIALFGGVQKGVQGFVNWPISFTFGIPAIFGVWLMRKVFIPALPEVIFDYDQLVITKRMLMFGLFAVVMFMAALSMLRNREVKSKEEDFKLNYPLLILQGLMLGLLTGFLGAGGGFLIIPALVLMANLDIRSAIGTSLVIIAMNALLGFFLGDALQMRIDWVFLFKFTSIALIGLVIGNWLGRKLNGSQLKSGFAYFILLMALFILYMEFGR